MTNALAYQAAILIVSVIGFIAEASGLLEVSFAFSSTFFGRPREEKVFERNVEENCQWRNSNLGPG